MKCKKLKVFDAIITTLFIGCLVDVLQNSYSYFQMIGHIFFITKLLETICEISVPFVCKLIIKYALATKRLQLYKNIV
jgi:hypothetical protein